MTAVLNDWISNQILIVETELQTNLTKITTDNNHHIIEVIKYGTLNGGKRIRPLLLFAVNELLGGQINRAIKSACALELIHCYSLIHDDLPAMDDDDMRRGRPSCHKKYGDAMAILAGDAMQSLAFNLLTQTKLSNEIIIQLVKILSIASQNMVFGQVLDIEAEQQNIDVKQLKTIHNHKTGNLIIASLLMGATIANANKATVKIIHRIGKNLGMAFQIQDDILDATGNSKTLGKSAGSDVAQNKSTFVSILGLKDAKKIASEYYQIVIGDIKLLSNHDNHLLRLVNLIIDRNY